MENSNKPINPILDMNQNLSNLIGLTKREYFAGLAMQGLLANDSHAYLKNDDVAEWAVKIADELLKQLEL